MTESAPRLSVVFAGTPDFSAAILTDLLKQPFDLKAVYCQPDRPKGRGKKMIPPPVKMVAESAGLPVYQPLNFKTPESIETLAALKPDVLVVVAYGLILPKTVLDIPRLGCVNIHASSLPRWRGAAPIERAIEAQDKETGITLIQMDEGLDTGDMLSHESIPIAPDETGDTLRSKMLEVSNHLLSPTLKALASGTAQSKPQDNDKACYAHKITREEALLDFHRKASEVAAKIRGFNSHHVCYTSYKEQRIKVFTAEVLNAQATLPPGSIEHVTKTAVDIACSDHLLRLTRVQLPGGKPLEVKALLNGNKIQFEVGTRFE